MSSQGDDTITLCESIIPDNDCSIHAQIETIDTDVNDSTTICPSETPDEHSHLDLSSDKLDYVETHETQLIENEDSQNDHQTSHENTQNEEPSTEDGHKHEHEHAPMYNMNTYEGRCASLENQLTNDSVRIINKNELFEFVFHHGVPERRYIRSLVWKLVLGYLSFDKDDWERDLTSSRRNYEMYLRELTANPYEKVMLKTEKSNEGSDTSDSNSDDCDPLDVLRREAVSPDEDPLACGQVRNEWTEYFKDEEIRVEIEKDVKRTYSTLHFFQLPVHPDDHRDVMLRKQLEEEKNAQDEGREPLILFTDFTTSHTNFASTAALASARRAIAKGKNKNRLHYQDQATQLQEINIGVDKGPDCHHDVLRRLLFLYAKLNPGVRYVQGMNEILAPIYYVFASEPDSVSKGKGMPYNYKGKSPVHGEEEPYLYSDAEADAFFCFTNVMAEIRDRFIKSLDESETGVLASVQKLNDLLKTCDVELWTHMSQLGVDPRFYSFRWLTLLSSQEFELPEVLRLWDSFFADRRRFDLHHYFCVGMLVNIRRQILAADFAEILRLLQQYPDSDAQHLIAVAHDLRVSTELHRRSKYVPAPPVPKEANVSPTVLISNFFNRHFGKK